MQRVSTAFVGQVSAASSPAVAKLRAMAGSLRSTRWKTSTISQMLSTPSPKINNR
jgi:hypothetical protein